MEITVVNKYLHGALLKSKHQNTQFLVLQAFNVVKCGISETTENSIEWERQQLK